MRRCRTHLPLVVHARGGMLDAMARRLAQPIHRIVLLRVVK